MDAVLANFSPSVLTVNLTVVDSYFRCVYLHVSELELFEFYRLEQKNSFAPRLLISLPKCQIYWKWTVVK